MIKPEVSIVIPCRNEEQYIGKCLDSIIALDYPKEKLTVMVCDGLSDDKTPSIVKDYADKHSFIKLLVNKKQTTPFALNLGLKASESDIKIILGAHAEVDSQFVEENIKALSQDAVGCAGGVIENVYEDQVSETIGKAMSSPFGVGNAHFRTGLTEGFVDTVAFGAYKKEVFEQLGYFDEDLIRNQDDEFNFRLLKHGFKIYLSRSIRSKYYVRGSLGKLYKQYFQYGYWKVYVNKKHRQVTTVRQLVPFFFVSYLFAGAIGCFFFHDLFPIYLFGLLCYAVMALFFAIKASSIVKAIIVAITFFILHFSYGLGYLQGILQFIILGKGPSSKQAEMSR